MSKLLTRGRELDACYQKFRESHFVLFRVLCAFMASALAIVFYYQLRNQNYQFFYSVNDDMYLRDMLNGELYAGTGYTIMIKKWLGTTLAMLYQWRPYTEWYALMMLGGIVVFLISISYSILVFTEKIWKVALFVFMYLVFSISFAQHFLVVTYTEVAAYLMLSSAMLAYAGFATYDVHKKNWLLLLESLGSIGLAVLSFSLRANSTIMMLPFAGILFLEYFLQTNRENRKKGVLFCVILFVCWCGIYVHDRLAYTTVEAYRQVLPYCEATNPIYNYYGVPEYTEHQAFYQSINMSKDTYSFFEKFYYLFAQDFNIHQVASIAEYTSSITPGKGIAYVFGNLKANFLFHNFFPLGFIALIATVLSVVVNIIEKNKRSFYLQLAVVVVYFIDALYLSYSGRLPDRVIIPLYVALMILSGMIIYRGMTRKSMAILSCGLCVWAVLGLKGIVKTDIQDSQGLQLTLFGRQEEVFHYMAEHEDNFYLISQHMHPTGGAFFYDKTLRMDNYVYYSDYTTYLPEWKWKVEEQGLDPAKMLDEFIENSNVLVISPDDSFVEVVEPYLEKYYPEMELQEVDILCGYYPVYNVIKK